MAGCWSASGRFLGLGRRGGTLRLKLATTSGGEWRLRVGLAKDEGGQEMAVEIKGEPTPSRCVGVVDGGVDVTKIDFAHETINLDKMGNEDEEQRLAKMRIR